MSYFYPIQKPERTNLVNNTFRVLMNFNTGRDILLSDFSELFVEDL